MKAVFPGSFDPPTYGHLDLIARLAGLFDELFVVIADNPRKKYLFTVEEREPLLQNLTKSFPNVQIAVWHSLMVEFLRKVDAKILARGIRGANDFAYEYEVAVINKSLYPRMETFFLASDPKYCAIRSSSVKELYSFGGDISSMTPPLVLDALKKKFHEPS